MELLNHLGSSLHAVVSSIYEPHAPDHILPFIGDGFREPCPDRLRVMVVGINAYVSASDWERKQPRWFRHGFAEQRHRFDRAVLGAAGEMAALVTSPGRLFERLRYDGLQSIYATDAVKVFVPEHRGKRAAQLSAADIEQHTGQWHDELRVLREHGAFPHLILVFGAPFWETAWKTFHSDHRAAASLGVRSMEPADGELRHHLNRIQWNDERETTLLVRLRHPVARTAAGAPKWIAAQHDVERALRA